MAGIPAQTFLAQINTAAPFKDKVFLFFTAVLLHETKNK